MAIWQCAHCGNRIDDQEDDHEAFEVCNQYGTHWHYFHVLCIDTIRTLERRRKELGTPEKSSLPKKVVGIRGSWSGEQVPST